MFQNSSSVAETTFSSNILTYLEETNAMLQNELERTSAIKENSNEKIGMNQSIFVCTFCQVFSTSSAALISHIGKEHGSILKEGTISENYISKLQPLKSEANPKPKNVGRPRKNKDHPNNPIVINEKIPVVPVLEADGFYWCKKCHKNFKKSRQFIRHVCQDSDIEDNESLEDTDMECDDTADFKLHKNIQPEPWAKKKKFNSCQSSTSLDKAKIDFQDDIAKRLLNWKEDPNYIPLFKTKDEKLAFESHLKNIDYKCVDDFIKKIRKIFKTLKNTSAKTSGYAYSCTVCSKEFDSLSHARLHCLTHTNLKPFTCPKCSYCTNVKASLFTHMRTHTGNVFSCTHCDYETLKRSHLLDHEQTHSTVRQGCKLCKNSYKTLRSLKLHIMKYHSNPKGKAYLKSLTTKQLLKKSATCNICYMSFQSHLSLETHKSTVHTIPVSVRLEKCHELEDTREQLIDKSIEIYDNSKTVMDEAFEKLSNFSSESFADVEYLPQILNCSVRLEPLDDRAGISNNSTSVIDEAFERMSKLSSESFADVQYIPPLLNCSVRIEPLDDRVISSHQYYFKCNLCDQKFISHSMLEDHRLLSHSTVLNSEHMQSQAIREKVSEQGFEEFNFNDPQVLSSLSECRVRVEPLDEQLVALMLNNLLQDKNTEPVPLFEDVFKESEHANLLMSEDVLSETLNTEKSREKLLPIEQFNSRGPSLQQFNIPDINLNFTDVQLMPEHMPSNSSILPKDILQFGVELDEQKSEEIKLFEKCKRAPAYVCCVCSSIFIHPSTLKAHLKEHINKNNSFVESTLENFQSSRLADDKTELDVCDILQESSTNDLENELEKLYTSSLHSMYYLPEVSVVLENDQSLIDSFLDDIPNLPISEKFDETESLQLNGEIFS